MSYNPKKESVVIMGDTQTGKTEHGITHTKSLASARYNILVLDLNRKFTKISPELVIHNLNEITGVGLQILQPHAFSSLSLMNQFFEDTCHIARKLMLRGNFIFVVDELQEWFNDQRSHIKPFELYCRTCHNHNSSYVSIFQSPSEIPKYVIRNAVHRFCLYVDLVGDVDYLKKLIGKEVTLFASNHYERFEGIYKKTGEAVQTFKVVRLV